MENLNIDIPNKALFDEKIANAKRLGSGFGIRFTKRELATIFGINDNIDEHKEILQICRNAFGEDFELIMPQYYVCLESPINPKKVAKLVIELIWQAIEKKKKTGTEIEWSKQDIYSLFEFEDTKDMPIDLLRFENAVDILDPTIKFVRHTEIGDMLYSTNEFNSVYKLFTYAGISPKTITLAWKKICDAKSGNLVRFTSNELGYIEAAELFQHRNKSYLETEIAYSVDEYFKILPPELIKETSPEFDIDNSKRFFSKIIYMGECVVKFAPYIIKCDKTIFKQNVLHHGAQAVDEMVRLITVNDEQKLSEARAARDLIIRASAGDLLINASSNDSGTIVVKPNIFTEVNFLTSLFSVTANDEKNENIALSIMRHSKEFCDDVGAVASAIGATSKAYDFATAANFFKAA